MTDNEIVKAWDILCKFDFFGGQRAGRELWNEKPADIQDKDIEAFSNDVAFLKDFINRQKAEIERLSNLHSLAVAEREANVKGFAETISKTKGEAIKEFAERLKGEMLGKYCVYFNFEISNAIIDNLVKEMAGEG